MNWNTKLTNSLTHSLTHTNKYHYCYRLIDIISSLRFLSDMVTL